MCSQLLAAADQPMHEMTPQQARDSFAALVVGGRPAEHVVPVRSVEDVTVPGAEGDLPARVYRPTRPARCRRWCSSTAAAG